MSSLKYNFISSEQEMNKRIVENSINYYLGKSTESLLTAMLQNEQYDVMNSNVDYGIDLIAIKRENIINKNPTPLFFQVKARNIYFSKAKKDYIYGTTSILISQSTLDLMEAYRNNFALFIFFYFDDRNTDEIINNYIPKCFPEYDNIPVTYCWFTFENIQNLELSPSNKNHKSKSISGTYYTLHFKVSLPKENKKYPYIQLSPMDKNFDKFDTLNNSKKNKHYMLRNFLK